MSKRWKPENGGKYWIVNPIANIQEIVWHNDSFDRIFYEIGNFFKTAAEAEAAAKKVKALLLSLHETVTECNQLPKLTAEVFERPDCPDAPRYKACGNSMCVNVMRWIGMQIDRVDKKESKND